MYECHVTIEPITNESTRTRVAEQARIVFGFKMANLLKVNDGTPNQQDQFFTAHDHLYSTLHRKMREFCQYLIDNEHKIYRYKIEEIILDSRYEADPLNFCK